MGVVRSALLVLTCAGIFSLLQAQPASPSWIFFKDKDRSLLNTPTEQLAEELGISRRALWRRAKVLASGKLLDEHDLPVQSTYIRQLEGLGLTIRSTSRWLNAVSVEAQPALLQHAREMGFVQSVRPVAAMRTPPVSISPAPPSSPSTLEKSNSPLNLDYGRSRTQLSNIRVDAVHALGINGTGVVVGMIDDGFNNHRSHVALKNIPVIDEFDFIHRITTTQRQPWEISSQGNHGALTLSALAGFDSGNLIGAAYGVSVILAKTEMDSTEIPAEEDLYVEALEWMERQGVEIVSTSLGYFDWYTYDDLDGMTATTSRAARVAARKGILLVTSMGNEGWFQRDPFGKPIPGQTGTLGAPADADSIVAVGAAYSWGDLVEFSSTGPSSDGRIKPEVVAQGVGVRSANGTTISGYVGASGTSLSTPLVAGSAALVLSAHPDLTPMQVREALIQTAVRIQDSENPEHTAVYPNNFYGHGFVDALAAVTYHGIAVSNKPRVLAREGFLTVYVGALSNTPLLLDSLALFYQTESGGPFLRAPLTQSAFSHWYTASLPDSSDTSFPRGYIYLRDSNGQTRHHPSAAPSELFNLRDLIVPDIPEIPLRPDEFVLHPGFPNPFNGETTILFDAPQSVPFEIRVYDILGRAIKVLASGISVIGTNRAVWDGTMDNGRRAASGVYFFRVSTPQFTQTRKLLFLQ